ncbi:MAG: DUF4876 domain-containing protein [Muribaculaceae bacterium]|nr:DUF4876 domain-containing protein [Muribaculaceae bacterium]
MRKFLYILPIVAMFLGFTACSSDDDEIVRHEVTVNVTLPEEVTKAQALESEIIVTAVNTTTNQESVAQVVDNVATFSLVPGTYNFTVSGEMDGFSLNGVQTGVDVFKAKSLNISLIASVGSTLVFKEVYFTGVPDWYFGDSFYEIYNNSDEVQYLDGIILGVVDWGLPPSVWSKDNPSIWMTNGEYADGYYPLASHVQYFPGNGTEHPVQPRTSVIVAANPLNHSARQLGETDKQSPVDLTVADWQLYKPNSDNDQLIGTKEIGKDIPPMTFLWAANPYIREMMPATEGQPLILARLKDNVSPEDWASNPQSVQAVPGGTNQCFMIPADCIIDAIDIVPADASCHIKRIEAKDDAGMIWVTGADGISNGDYSGKSLRRKVVGFTPEGKAILKDTNNSSNDFVKGGSTPTPGVLPTVVD